MKTRIAPGGMVEGYETVHSDTPVVQLCSTTIGGFVGWTSKDLHIDPGSPLRSPLRSRFPDFNPQWLI